MSTYKKIDNSQKILKLSPDHSLPRAKRGAFFLSKFITIFYSSRVMAFFALTLLVSEIV